MPTIGQRVSALENLIASFFSGATKTSKVRVKRAVKRAKATSGRRATKAKRAVKRAVRKARRKATS